MQAVLKSGDFQGVPPGLGHGEALSGQLRRATVEGRRWAEARTGLGGTAGEAGAACLVRARRFYRPLEARLSRFGQWAGLEIELGGLSRVARLDEGDEGPGVRALDAPREALPHLPTFAHALGGLFAAATFSPGRGVAGCPVFGCIGEGGEGWRLFEGVDLYGVEWPGSIPLVMEGAERTFVAIGRWMDARHWHPGHPHPEHWHPGA